MAEIVPFPAKDLDAAERPWSLRSASADLLAATLGLTAISASLRSASDHGKAVLQQLERDRESLRISQEFYERCMAALELPSLAEMVMARDELIVAFARQSTAE